MVDERRGKNVAIAGAGLQMALTAVMLGLWMWTDSRTLLTVTALLAAGVPVWLFVALLMYARQLERREAIELEELAQSHKESVFEEEDESRPAVARLRWFDKYGCPGFTLLMVVIQAGIAFLVWYLYAGRYSLRGAEAPPPADVVNAGKAMLFPVLLAFAGFLFGRYVVGMSSGPRWRLLRAPASYLLVNVYAIALAFGMLLAAKQGYGHWERYVAWVVPAIQAILAGELLLNFILELFRPRVPGREHRYSFDSRLLNLAAQPGRFGHSIADALNYQFGFEVSGTWFYQLLRRVFVPLLLAGAVVLVGITSVAIIQEGEVGVLKHWGRLKVAGGTLRPGMHLKWPWPVETVDVYDIASVQEVQPGAGEERTEEERRAAVVDGVELYLWTAPHGVRKELDFLLAAEPYDSTREPGRDPAGAPAAKAEQEESEQQATPDVRIIKLVAPVHYVITDPYKYGYRFANPDKLLECLAHREMTNYAASATLDEPVGEEGTDRPEAIMTFGREKAARELKRRIQAAVDELDMGVEIRRVSIISAHPLKEVAPDFEAVLKAERFQEQQRYQAHADANRMLSQAAGKPQRALTLALEIRTVTDLQSLAVVQGDPEQFAKRSTTYIKEVEQAIGELDREIRIEEARGRVAEGLTERRKLREQYQEYLDLLRSIKEQPDRDLAAQIAAHRRQAETLLGQAGGEPVRIIEEAKVYRWEKELAVRSRLSEVERKIPSYRACEPVYALNEYLEIYEKYAPNLPKYIMAADPNKVELWLNWEPSSRAASGIRLDQENATGQ